MDGLILERFLGALRVIYGNSRQQAKLIPKGLRPWPRPNLECKSHFFIFFFFFIFLVFLFRIKSERVCIGLKAYLGRALRLSLGVCHVYSP